MARTSSSKDFFYLLLAIAIAPSIFQVIKNQYWHYFNPGHRVGVVSLRKVITSSHETIRQLSSFFKDDSIKALVLRMDCPGGAAGSSQAIYGFLKAMRAQYPQKPVVTLVENMCASGGYYIACASDHIITTPSAFVGSIGAYISVPMVKKLMETIQIEPRITKAGEYKTSFSPFLERTADQERLVQNLCNDTYKTFVEDVRKNRPQIANKQESEWANGKIFTGSQALSIGLVDQIGTSYDVEEWLKNSLQLSAHDEITFIKAPMPSFISKLFGSDTDDTDQELHFAATSLIALANSVFQSVAPYTADGQPLYTITL